MGLSVKEVPEPSVKRVPGLDMLQGRGVSRLPESTFVVTDPIEIVRALVGLKDVRVLA